MLRPSLCKDNIRAAPRRKHVSTSHLFLVLLEWLIQTEFKGGSHAFVVGFARVMSLQGFHESMAHDVELSGGSK